MFTVTLHNHYCILSLYTQRRTFTVHGLTLHAHTIYGVCKISAAHTFGGVVVVYIKCSPEVCVFIHPQSNDLD